MPPTKHVVLVVEDEPMQRMMAVDLVEDAGYEAVQAMGSNDAVCILESRPDIRIVFTDIDMPGGLDGMKLAALIRDRWPPIELIIISGKRRPSPADLPKRGVFFSKPYKREEITAALRRFAA
ncbi:response regulator [Methylobacterium sp. A49B]|uniref:Response regulator n=1 Tax=Methylobacterium mesophilicum SR1.6/6 TaxID=908290 RepID=A0A6B9FTC6_9HYPH|nr:response regulator [Methylobacterium mesophilicum]QGY05953.1 response regulator [Methylobacterium mesophilicum SR1.6/6]